MLFSRVASDEYLIHVALFEDLHASVRMDLGLLGFIQTIFSQGLQAAFSQVHVLKPEDIAQVYLNIMLFIPMGYLLPYVFSYFRAKARIRPVVCCFIVSFIIENMQLITRRGFYDADDLISNTLGGLIGQTLFMLVAYVVTHPTWRKDLRSYRTWRKHARHKTLYPFARRLGMCRTTLRATDEEAIWDFYVMKLGYRLKKQIVPLDAPATTCFWRWERARSRSAVPTALRSWKTRRSPSLRGG